MKTAAPLLVMSDVIKIYRVSESLFGKSDRSVRALDHLSITINAGEIYGLVGESGSGKTTASRLIVGLEEADSGHIRFEGQDVVGLRGKRRKAFTKNVQIIFQDPYQSLNAHLSIFETVCEPLVIHGEGDRQSRLKKVCEALSTAGLSPPEAYLGRYPHQLSGGQRQRVAIARAMVLEPRFLIADEPTSMLDTSISFQIFQLLNQLRVSFGVTMLFITHSLAAARNLCDRVGVIYRGRLVEEGTASQTIMEPHHPYTKALLDAHPHFGSSKHRRYNTLKMTERTVPSADHCPFYPRCRSAMKNVCDSSVPVFKKIGDDHHVACFLF
jgi:peptide/nickel transport system ATP-binding protein